jgi:endonuclease-3
MPAPSKTVSPRLRHTLGALRRHYGTLKRPPARSAFELVIWEKVAYLATDARRLAAFELLRKTVGLTPQAIVSAKPSAIVDALTAGGIAAPERATHLIAAAELVIGEFDGRLDDVCSRPLGDAKRALKRIYGIADPGAEKILLLTGTHRVLGLDSNGLRVLSRLGYGVQSKTYSTTYKSATDAALVELGAVPIPELIQANLLLRHHGQALCKTSNPKCGACVLRDVCPSAREFR